MVLFFPKIWSGKSSTAEFEKQLADLQKQIGACERQIAQLRSRQRRFAGLFLFYSTLAYLIYGLSVWLVNYGRLRSINWHHPVAVVSIPFLIYLGRRLIDWWYTSGLERRYERLHDLHSRQQTKVGQLKQATGFDVTQSLLQRYGGDPQVDGLQVSGPGPSTPSKKQQGPTPPPPPPPYHQRSPWQERTRQNEPTSKTTPTLAMQGQPQGQPQAAVIGAEPQQPLPPPPPTPNRWYDRILDLLVGEDETAPQNRFALICWRCRHHNGLAPPGTPASEVEYQCPACGVWNPQAHAAATEAKTKAEAEIQAKPETKTEDSESKDENIPDEKESKSHRDLSPDEKSQSKEEKNGNTT